ncbi:MAG: four helix bundle protein [bacterium]
MPISTYQDLTVWQRSIDLIEAIYALTDAFPREERFGLTSQCRRAAVSIAANIAEGYGRSSRRDYAHFIGIAFGSARELETLLVVAIRIRLTTDDDCIASRKLLDECCRMLNVLYRKLRQDQQFTK